MTGELVMGAAAAVVLFVFSSLVEYVTHILMHKRVFLGKVHTAHHKDNSTDGFLWEFIYYCPLAVPVGTAALVAGLYFGYPGLGVGAFVGAVGYAAFAAYAHQVQHERPELVFWMPTPVHTVHHVYQQWRTNFGIGVDWWDRAFGTYERTAWRPDPSRRPKSLFDFVRIQWGRGKAPAGTTSRPNRVPTAT
jgi:sterol desaturase/sphingolipid hydroxylase (fatty acid hydroxylase superfamily)